MRLYAIKSIMTFTLGAAALVGCASSPSSSTMASSQGSVQSGKVVSVGNPNVPGPAGSASSSGASAGGTTASGAPALVTVLFADGTQGTFSIDQQPADPFAVGDAVKIITDADGITIISP